MLMSWKKQCKWRLLNLHCGTTYLWSADAKWSN